MFNHNAYLINIKNAVFTKNAFLRASSIGMSMLSSCNDCVENLLIEDNLFVEGEIGLGLWSFPDITANNITVRKNVFMHIGRARPTNRHLSWAIGQGMHSIEDLTIEDNIIAHQTRDSLAGNTSVIELNNQHTNTTIRNNIIYNYKSSHGLFRFGKVNAGSSIHVEENTFHSISQNPRLFFLDLHGSTTLANNHYFADAWSTIWFSLDWNTHIDFTEWAASSGEENPSFELPNYANPDITLEDYLSVENLGTSLTDYISLLTNQGKEGWDQRLEIPVVNQFIRSGFDLVESSMER